MKTYTGELYVLEMHDDGVAVKDLMGDVLDEYSMQELEWLIQHDQKLLRRE